MSVTDEDLRKVAAAIAIDDMPEPQLMMTSAGTALWRVKDLGSHWLDIIPLIYNFRLVTTRKDNERVYDHGWCYEGIDKMAFAAVLLAAWAWDGTEGTSPPGHFRQAC